jgi:hypothetical protein
MNDFCELIELTASDLYEVAGGNSHGHGHSGGNTDVDVSVRVKLVVINNASTSISNGVDNSINL